MDAIERRFIAEYWWVLTLRGAAAVLFGIAAVFWPGITLVTLLYLFSAYILVSGVIDIVHGVGGISKRASWFLTLILGFAELGVGVYLLRHPHVAFATFILLLGFMLIVRGVLEGVAAFSDSTSATNRTLMIIASIVAIVAGIILLFQPASAGVAFVWILGLYALLVGPIMIALSLDLKKSIEA
ncbi:MAG TPA: DUF308 domain-containing protein [Candidatus Saccharimonadales bacterium]|nr:DUF308 domain-containing protein [Candidatus Saccharimonadales bacterium]